MTILNEIEYCRRREATERGRARTAACAAAHDAHFMMAERYADKIYSLPEQTRDTAASVHRRPVLRIAL